MKKKSSKIASSPSADSSITDVRHVVSSSAPWRPDIESSNSTSTSKSMMPRISSRRASSPAANSSIPDLRHLDSSSAPRRKQSVGPAAFEPEDTDSKHIRRKSPAPTRSSPISKEASGAKSIGPHASKTTRGLDDDSNVLQGVARKGHSKSQKTLMPAESYDDANFSQQDGGKTPQKTGKSAMKTIATSVEDSHSDNHPHGGDPRKVVRDVDQISLGDLPQVEEVPKREEKAFNTRDLQRQHQASLAFAQAVEHSAKLPWRRGRIILIGRGQAGKSSTVRSLMGKPFDPTVASTIGVNTANLEVNRAEVQNWSEQGTGPEMLEAMAGLVAHMQEKDVDAGLLDNPITSGPAAGSGASAARVMKDRLVCETQVQEVAKLLTEEMMSDSDKQLTLSLWDCGGQQVFYNLIHLFFTRCAVYLCIFDMRQMVHTDQRAEAIETLSFWLDSVHLHARGAPVLLVGTFADVVDSPGAWEEIDNILWGEFSTRIKECVRPFNGSAGDFWFFPLDNTKKNAVVDQLRMSIESSVLEDPMRYIDKEVPVAWRQVLDRLRGAVGEEQREYMTIEEVQRLSESNKVPDWQVPEMLKVFHELGTILHFSSLPELKRILILQPQWLIDAVCRLLCDFSLHESNEAHGLVKIHHAEDFEVLKNSGVASRPLLDAIWCDYDKSADDYTLRNFFIKLLQEMVLMCPLPHGRCLVPGLLPMRDLHPRDPKLRWMTFWIDCGKTSFPPGLFSRLVCLCAELCHELGGAVECLSSIGADMSFGVHRFRMEVEQKSAIRFAVLDNDGGPALVLRHIVTFMEQLTVSFMKGLEFDILLGASNSTRTSAPSRDDVTRAVLDGGSATFRPPWSKRWFHVSDFFNWFTEDVHMSKVVHSQWSRLSEDWPFLQRYEYDDAQKVALHQYLQDPGQWGLEWSALEQLEKKVKLLAPYESSGEDPVPWEKMNMWHVVQLLVKPLCADQGAPLALVYGDWQPRRVEEFVSHCWSELFCEFMASLRHVYDTRKQKPTLFVCAFALYQGSAADVGRQLAGPIRDAPFIKALQVSRHFVAVRNQDTDIYTRAWCLVEFFFAKKLGFFSHKVSITGPNTFASAAQTSCLDLEASDESDRQRVVEFLLQEASIDEIDKQIQEFRDYDAGFENYHSHFRSTD